MVWWVGRKEISEGPVSPKLSIKSNLTQLGERKKQKLDFAHMAKSRLAGRDAINGQFITVEEARHRRSTATVERIDNPR